jgi:hypothetical protein
MKKNIKRSFWCLLPVITIGLTIGCQPDEFEGNGNGLIGEDLDPTFVIEPVTVEGKMNTYQFKLNSIEDVVGVFWDLGDGALSSGMQTTDVIFFPDADTYTIKTQLVGKGGELFESEQQLVVATSDPKYGNLLKGGRLNEGDEDFWSILQYSGGVSPQFTGDKVLFDYGGWSHAGIYQSFEAVAGQKYRIDMTMTGNGAQDTWFEVYIGMTDPATVSGDYNEGGTRLGLNTWAGCGKTKFGDKLTKLSCVGSSSGDGNGVFEVAETGTYYIVIRTGGANLGTGGISVDNIEIRPYFD